MAVIKAVSSKAGIGQALDYVTKEEKTEDKLVSGLHCEPETVKEEMQATKELWGKTDGRTYIIGGADGPTSVFVAGKLNSVLVSILLIAIGVVMLIVAIIFYFLKKK